MKNFILIFFLFFIAHLKAYSQKEFLPGFIITNSNDSVFGELENERDIYSGSFCIFKSRNDSIDRSRQYLPNEIIAYYLTNNRYFVSKTLQIGSIEKTVFVQVLIEGSINIYKYKSLDRQVYYFIEKKDLGIQELLPSAETIVKRHGNSYLKTVIPSNGILKFYTSDVPDLEEKINNISDLYSKSLIDVAKDYHNAVCKDEDCNVYFYEY